MKLKTMAIAMTLTVLAAWTGAPAWAGNDRGRRHDPDVKRYHNRIEKNRHHGGKRYRHSQRGRIESRSIHRPAAPPVKHYVRKHHNDRRWNRHGHPGQLRGHRKPYRYRQPWHPPAKHVYRKHHRPGLPHKAYRHHRHHGGSELGWWIHEPGLSFGFVFRDR